MMIHAQKIREGLEKMRFEGKPRFIILDDGDKNCLPVVTAMLNPECNFEYDDIDLQHAISPSPSHSFLSPQAAAVMLSINTRLANFIAFFI